MTRTIKIPYRDRPIVVPKGVNFTQADVERYPNLALAIGSYDSTEPPLAYCRTTYVYDYGKYVEGEYLLLRIPDYNLYYLRDKDDYEDCIIQNGIETYLVRADDGRSVITEYTTDPEIAKILFERPFVNPFGTKVAPKLRKAKDNGPVKVLCYDEEDLFKSRDQAIAFYIDCVEHSEGAERDRYVNILLDLNDGKEYATDGVSQIPENRQDKTRKSPKKVAPKLRKAKTSTKKTASAPKKTVKKTPTPKKTVAKAPVKKEAPTKAKTSTKKVTKTAPKKTVKRR